VQKEKEEKEPKQSATKTPATKTPNAVSSGGGSGKSSGNKRVGREYVGDNDGDNDGEQMQRKKAKVVDSPPKTSSPKKQVRANENEERSNECYCYASSLRSLS